MTVDLDAALGITVAPSGLLVLGDAPYVLVSLGTPLRQWRRATVEGRYQHGRALLGAVLEQATLVVEVRVQAVSWAAQQAALDALLAAVSQRNYQVEVSVEGRSDWWVCEPADVVLSTGETLEKHLVMSAMQEYILRIPAHPLPVALDGPA